MGKKDRLTIGIILNFSPKWMGGVIYILNAIKILNWLEDEDKPEVKLFYRKDLKRFVDEIEYPYLESIEWKFPSIHLGYLHSWVSGINHFVEPMLKVRRLDAIFPVHDYPVRVRPDVKMVSWYADLQHKYYPEFFTRRKLFERDARIRLILRHAKHLVVSSQEVANDFRKFFRLRPEMQIHIFHFVSVVDSFDFSNIHDLRKKYQLPEHYFMVSNQFHKHKNHQILLDALVLLKQQGIRLFLAMTGKLPEDSGSPYIRNLRTTIEQHQLQEQVRFLGVLPRADQLSIMRYAQAVIQPSLFEGWSTVIEDAVSVHTPVIASNLKVNIEQLGEKGSFFNPHSSKELASILFRYPMRDDYDKKIYQPYNKRMKQAANTFLSIMTK